MAETAQLNVRIDLEGNLSKGIMGAQKQLTGLNRSVGRVGKGIGQVGAGIARAGLLVGGAAIAGLTAAAREAITFEDAFAGVRKTVDEADLTAVGLSFESLSKAFRGMATEIPISATEFARLGETAGALGIKAQDIQEFTRVTALMGVTTNLSADEAADAFGRIGTILGLTGDDYQELADSIVAVGNAGASTESEITEVTKRFASQAKQLGLNKEQMVGLASATASLGFEPERGGTALARVFANLSTNIATANGEGEALSEGLGRSIKDLQKDIDKGKGLNVFMDVLETIKGMSRTESARFLKDIGVTNTSDRTIFQAMSQQLPFVNEQLEIARNAQGALLKEAEQRFATTASKIQLFKNNIIEAGIAIGDEMLPAVRRALDKVIGALKDPSTKSDLVKLGKDIGQAIDDIDWAEVVKGAREFVGVMKSALGFVMTILEAINKLPSEVKAAAAGLLVLNKASGGLVGAGVGNIVGGLGETVARSGASKLPGVGKLFAQPVFVTNWPMGGLGGVPLGPGGKGGGLGSALSIVSKVLVVGMVAEVASQIAGPLVQLGKDLGKNFRPQEFEDFGAAWTKWRANADWPFGQKNAPEWAGGKPPEPKNTVKTGGMSPDERQELRTQNQNLTTEIGTLRVAQETSTGIVADRVSETKRENSRGLSLVTSTTRTGSASIVSAIQANRPQTFVNVNVSATTVKHTVEVTNRYGSTGGSRQSNRSGVTNTPL